MQHEAESWCSRPGALSDGSRGGATMALSRAEQAMLQQQHHQQQQQHLEQQWQQKLMPDQFFMGLDFRSFGGGGGGGGGVQDVSGQGYGMQPQYNGGAPLGGGGGGGY